MPRSNATSFPRPALCAAFALICTACQDPAPSPEVRAVPTTSLTALASVAATAPTASPKASVTSATSGPTPSSSQSAATIDAGATHARDAGANDKPKDAELKDAGPGTITDGRDGGTADAAVEAEAADAGAVEPAPTAGSADAVAAEIDKIFLGRPTYSAKFRQDFTQKISGAAKKSSGTIFVEKPNRISFRYEPPNKNRIVSDGTTLKVYVAEDNQMFLSPVQNTEYPGALAFVMGRGLLPSFTFTFNEKAKATFSAGPVLHGKPRSPTPHYESVFFYVDQALLAKRDPNVIRRVLILDAQGNKNRFDFEGATQPATIDPAEFTFTPPEGTNVTKN